MQEELNQFLWWAEQDMAKGPGMPFPGLWASMTVMGLVKFWSDTLAQNEVITQQQHERIKAVLTQCQECLNMQFQ